METLGQTIIIRWINGAKEESLHYDADNIKAVDFTTQTTLLRKYRTYVLSMLNTHTHALPMLATATITWANTRLTI